MNNQPHGVEWLMGESIEAAACRMLAEYGRRRSEDLCSYFYREHGNPAVRTFYARVLSLVYDETPEVFTRHTLRPIT